MADSQDPFFVGVKDANKIRRELLLSSKEILTALKSHEVLKGIRRAKIECYFELRTVMEELMILNRKLRGSLPKTSLKPSVPKPKPRHVQRAHKEHKKHHTSQPHQHHRHHKKPAPSAHKDQVEMLQEAMSRVDAQLRELESMVK